MQEPERRVDTPAVPRLALHRYLVESLESEGIAATETPRTFLQERVAELIDRFVQEQRLATNRLERDRLIREMVDEILGYGPIEGLLQDEAVSDVLINGPEEIWVERHGRLTRTDLAFMDREHVQRVVQRMLAGSGRRLDESQPMVDARLPDGSRLNAIIAPLAVDGPNVSIRKSRRERLTASDLLNAGTLTAECLRFLQHAVAARCNVLVTGGTGAGKTTLLNVLCQDVAAGQRLVVIEDAAELQVEHPHVVRLETRPPNAEGRGEVTAREILRNVLRMRPDRILLGEVRDREVLDLLQAMNTGHDGSMSTLHANSAADALSRLEMLGGIAGFRGSERTLREMIATAVDLIVHVARLADGERRVTAVTELLEVRDGGYVTNELYRLDGGRMLRATGMRSVGAKLPSASPGGLS